MLPAGCESGLEIYDLPQFRLRELAPLLTEEVEAWKHSLYWDYATSSDLVGQFIDAHALSGNVICTREVPAGYSYFICEERKALLGCLFLSASYDHPETRMQLLEATIDNIRQRSSIRRIEAQFMLHEFGDAAEQPPLGCELFERLFMRVELPHQRMGGWQAPLRKEARVESWHERYQDRAAHLIEEAYRGHLDSRINDQYQTVEGARRFLYNIIQYPGCGTFAPESSFIAVENGSGKLLAGCLASIVDAGVGHITQVCTVPSIRGVGMGRHLIERSLDQLRARGCTSTTLTVTAANESAVRLYEHLGFTVVRRFPAYVWQDV